MSGASGGKSAGAAGLGVPRHAALQDWAKPAGYFFA